MAKFIKISMIEYICTNIFITNNLVKNIMLNIMLNIKWRTQPYLLMICDLLNDVPMYLLNYNLINIPDYFNLVDKQKNNIDKYHLNLLHNNLINILDYRDLIDKKINNIDMCYFNLLLCDNSINYSDYCNLILKESNKCSYNDYMTRKFFSEAIENLNSPFKVN